MYCSSQFNKKQSCDLKFDFVCFSGNTLEGVRTEKWWHNGLYEVIAYAVIEDPLEPTVFHCELRIPEAQYEIRKNFIYYPGEYKTRSYTYLLAAKVFREQWTIN